jgi:hypothetical protein
MAFDAKLTKSLRQLLPVAYPQFYAPDFDVPRKEQDALEQKLRGMFDKKRHPGGRPEGTTRERAFAKQRINAMLDSYYSRNAGWRHLALPDVLRLSGLKGDIGNGKLSEQTARTAWDEVKKERG